MKGVLFSLSLMVDKLIVSQVWVTAQLLDGLDGPRGWTQGMEVSEKSLWAGSSVKSCVLRVSGASCPLSTPASRLTNG